MRTVRAAWLGGLAALLAVVPAYAVDIISPALGLKMVNVLSLDGKATDAQLDARLAAFTNAIVSSKSGLTSNASSVIEQALSDPSVVNAGSTPVVLSSCSLGLNCCAVQFLDQLKPCLKFCVQCLAGLLPGDCRLTCSQGFAQCVNQTLCSLGVCLNGKCPTAGPPGGPNDCFPSPPPPCKPCTGPYSGTGIGTVTYELGKSSGAFLFSWSGDDCKFTISGAASFTTGCGTGSQSISYSGTGGNACMITVSIGPNDCDHDNSGDVVGEANLAHYTITCP